MFLQVNSLELCKNWKQSIGYSLVILKSFIDIPWFSNSGAFSSLIFQDYHLWSCTALHFGHHLHWWLPDASEVLVDVDVWWCESSECYCSCWNFHVFHKVHICIRIAMLLYSTRIDFDFIFHNTSIYLSSNQRPLACLEWVPATLSQMTHRPWGEKWEKDLFPMKRPNYKTGNMTTSLQSYMHVHGVTDIVQIHLVLSKAGTIHLHNVILSRNLRLK